MNNLKENALVQEMSAEEMMSVNGGMIIAPIIAATEFIMGLFDGLTGK